MKLRRTGKFRRGLFMLASAVPSLASLPGAMLRAREGNKWLMPLMLFLGATGLVLIVAGAVEALAPFVYAIF